MAKKETKTNAMRILETMKIEYEMHYVFVIPVAEEIDFKKAAEAEFADVIAW